MTPDLRLEMRQEELEDSEDERIINFRLSPEDFEVARKVNVDQKKEFLNKLEEKRVELTPAQEEIVSLANEEIANVLNSYNLDLPDKVYSNTDIVPLDFAGYKDATGQKAKTAWGMDSVGVYISQYDKALLWYKKGPWSKDGRNQEFLHTVSHELLHAKSYLALQAFRGEGGGDVNTYRSGLQLIKLGSPEKGMFHALNEAITETLAAQVTNQVINNQRDLFHEKFVEQILYELAKAISYKKSKVARISDMKKRWEDWMDSNARRDDSGHILYETRLKEDFIQQLAADPKYRYEYPEQYQPYGRERKMFEKLVKALTEKSEEYGGREKEIRSLFYQAYTSGQMLPVGRLVEKTLGKGTFRFVAENPFFSELNKRLE